MTEIRFGGRCEKHLCPKPCTKCAERLGMTEQITVPRETWDAMREALQIADNIALAGTAYTPKSIETGLSKIREALTAANAVIDHFRGVTEMVQPIGWYSVSRDGIATLCLDRKDAEKTAKNGNKYWPKHAPYRAVQLCEFEAHPQATEPAWRPIETAPKDGTLYLALEGADMWVENEPEGHFAGNWVWSESRRHWRGHAHSDDRFATHWMPLPAAPEANQ